MLAGEFARCLRLAGADVRKGPRFEPPTNRAWNAAVYGVYRSLGGVQGLNDFLPRPGSFDFNVDGLLLEIDESLHWNRYRAITLQAEVYSGVDGWVRSQYADWCRDRENLCLKAGSYGRKWTTGGSEKQFGAPGPEGELHNVTPPHSGSPRWAQRALYDFCKDAAAILLSRALSRVSIWEELTLDGQSKTVEGWLKTKRRPSELPKALLDLVRMRTIRLSP